MRSRRRRRPAAVGARPDRLTLIVAVLGVAAVIAAGVYVAIEEREPDGVGAPAAGDPGPVHVHGLGVNPADGALFIATHTGLYRAADGERQAERVGDRLQDTMGFTVAGPDRFLGSGHPDVREAQEKGLPPHLGLIESTDGGRTWQPVSLLGEADFHVLRLIGERVYGYDATNGRLMISADGGRTWTERTPPGAVVDIAVDPGDPQRVLVATVGGPDDGLHESRDEGVTWTRVADVVALLAWPAADRLYAVTGGGLVLVSSDRARTFERRGDIGGQPAAFVAEGRAELYAALHDGTVKRTLDGGRTWAVRSAP